MASTNAKPAVTDKAESQEQQPAAEQKPTSSALGEDDEFEDFPVDDWPDEQTEGAQHGGDDAKHLWEESWDDDDTNDDFSAQLKEELKKVDAAKRR
ncbi:DSS1/SEM1 family protein [Drechmeria coniospora]|uniref:26S proteasome complex subunit SEM1 n=1 Tax=Drechmeria coniospora TaxID=98403 RepID=A0A151GBE4_DRECN|nr:DSS1/SEM1 family protein [Drechmeria coniospora]KYK54427.1 DSS1/SEM1 family protein [Drechmeria coniospora]ODA77291.1 hypothetical protein RJ55_06918 [Drechmeria coniospora]